MPLFTGAITNALPLHIVANCGKIFGFGCTVIVTVKLVPEQMPALGVTK